MPRTVSSGIRIMCVEKWVEPRFDQGICILLVTALSFLNFMAAHGIPLQTSRVGLHVSHGMMSFGFHFSEAHVLGLFCSAVQIFQIPEPVAAGSTRSFATQRRGPGGCAALVCLRADIQLHDIIEQANGHHQHSPWTIRATAPNHGQCKAHPHTCKG